MAGFEGFITIVFFLASVVIGIMDWSASEETDPTIRRSMHYGMGVVAVMGAILISAAIVMEESYSWEAWGVVILVMGGVFGGSYLGIQINDREIKNARSCDKCGTIYYNPDKPTPMKFCSKCGAELLPGKPAHHEKLLE